MLLDNASKADTGAPPCYEDTSDTSLTVTSPESSSSSTSHKHHDFCMRCSSELETPHGLDVEGVGARRKPWNFRIICISGALLFTILLFSFSVVHMAAARRFLSPSVLVLFVALWLIVTFAALGLLRVPTTLNLFSLAADIRTTVQIRILLALGLSWIPFIVGLRLENHSACDGYYQNRLSCGMFTTVNVLSWFLVASLLASAYATYHRARSLHGSELVPVVITPLVPAWRLSNVGDGPGKGAIKI
ncbi:hypothetical protein FB45DRAFT_937037 [Roridomyces roridus]|uniref:Uncharacterized protein n=1 Tax=Roridomyces roridus TaxID=1738132 RepID=A0AAD7B974_9AGAR|nr:hypothetical protein FB45DRAFT_937037 [Roridomyces roridus]